MTVKKKRPWYRAQQIIQLDPSLILIAGEDFDCPEDHPLRDAQSAKREAIDPEYVEQLSRGGINQAVLVVPFVVEGYEKVPVVVDGRRLVRHARALNEEQARQGLPLLKVRVDCRSLDLEMAGDVARLRNREGIPETDNQRVAYVRRRLAKGHDREGICFVLGINESMFKNYRTLGEAEAIGDLADQVMTLLDKNEDEGGMSLSAAVTLARSSLAEQKRVLKVLKGQKLTVGAVKRAVSGESGRKILVSPPKKRMREVLEREDLTERERMFLRWFLGEQELELEDLDLEIG